jgi:hypothetical protein
MRKPYHACACDARTRGSSREHDAAGEQPQVPPQPVHPQVVDLRAPPKHHRAAEVEVEEHPLEVVREAR